MRKRRRPESSFRRQSVTSSPPVSVCLRRSMCVAWISTRAVTVFASATSMPRVSASTTTGATTRSASSACPQPGSSETRFLEDLFLLNPRASAQIFPQGEICCGGSFVFILSMLVYINLANVDWITIQSREISHLEISPECQWSTDYGRVRLRIERTSCSFLVEVFFSKTCTPKLNSRMGGYRPARVVNLEFWCQG